MLKPIEFREMISFLKESKKILSLTEKVCVVLGNESCDLDSAVSAITLAYFYSKCKPTLETDTTRFIPLLNIPRKSYPIKTEVVYFLNKYNISEENLIFNDDTSSDFIKNNTVILVDHHVSHLKEVVEVFDHRPLDASNNLPKSCKVNIEQVGSCATLIGDLILNATKCNNEFNIIFELLYGAIVLDTVNFSRQACRATELDFKVAEEIEAILGIVDPMKHRENIFNELVRAREDISALNALQLLYKDMKIISSPDKSIIVGIPGYPISVQEFILKADAKEAIQTFSKEINCDVVLLIGMKITNDAVARDVGVVNFSNEELFNKIIGNLQNHNTSPNLQLKEHLNCDFLQGRFFQQGNIRATRKHILPIVKNIIENK